MPERKITPQYIADHIRRVLRDGGSAPHSQEVQVFFKEVVKSRGWYTAELRKVAVRMRRSVVREMGMEFLVQVTDQLFSGRVLEEKVFAVFLLENETDLLGEKDFRLFASWLDRISSWADHDALVHGVLAPMLIAKPARSREVFRWAKSRNRWQRRAACVALIRGTREKMFFPEIMRLSETLLGDEDDMVQKGLGWLLRESAKYDPKRTVPYLMKIRGRAPRLVIRTACETLPIATKKKILLR
ncbi:MAG: DNA alkylation repair protein [Terriglobales bacterium]|jgi:3-methyladenine DNA glycosylase AlkD